MLPSTAKHRQQRTFQARHVQWTKINRQELACPAQCRWLLSTNTSWSQQCREMLMGYLKWTWKSKTNNEPKISRNTRRWNLRYRQLNFKNVGETRGATHYSLSWVWAVKKKRFLFILQEKCWWVCRYREFCHECVGRSQLHPSAVIRYSAFHHWLHNCRENFTSHSF